MNDAFQFWLMKPLAEIAIGFVVLVAVLLVYGLASLPGYIKQSRCKHEKVREDGLCNAWCRTCGKNLGFIGTWLNNKA